MRKRPSWESDNYDWEKLQDFHEIIGSGDTLKVLLGKGYITQPLAKELFSNPAWQRAADSVLEVLRALEERLSKFPSRALRLSSEIKEKHSSLTQSCNRLQETNSFFAYTEVVAFGRFFAFNRGEAEIRQQIMLAVDIDDYLINAQHLQVDHFLNMLGIAEKIAEKNGMSIDTESFEIIRNILKPFRDPENPPLPPGRVRTRPLNGKGGQSLQ